MMAEWQSGVRYLVTGANGFVGRALCKELQARNEFARAAVRKVDVVPAVSEVIGVGQIDGSTDWARALSDIDVVVHLAGRAHVMKEHATDALEEFRKINVEGTANLARQAAVNGVKRFVYVSSIKVNGEKTAKGRCFAEDDKAAPRDSYGISKWEAEQALQRISHETGMQVVIVRPPLVYGPGAKGNFALMVRMIGRRAPLPFAAIQNQRSLIYVDNLVDALIRCATHPSAAGRLYLVKDGDDISTTGLLRLLGDAMGKPARLLWIPQWMLKTMAASIGKSAQLSRLLGSLCIDDARIRSELSWSAPYTLQDGIVRTLAEPKRRNPQ